MYTDFITDSMQHRDHSIYRVISTLGCVAKLVCYSNEYLICIYAHNKYINFFYKYLPFFDKNDANTINIINLNQINLKSINKLLNLIIRSKSVLHQIIQKLLIFYFIIQFKKSLIIPIINFCFIKIHIYSYLLFHLYFNCLFYYTDCISYLSNDSEIKIFFLSSNFYCISF